MTDPCLSRIHLGPSAGREHLRHDRETLPGPGGDRTSECLAHARPDLTIPGTKYLLVEQRTGRVYPLRVGLNRLGRHPDNDIVFEEMDVSRRHCVILVHARGGCELRDTDSLNGTFLNGQQVRKPARLTSGDCIEVSAGLLLFVSEQDDLPAPEDAVLGTAFG
jgi:pSer/pThr/pTyr-binding forkhead associated (FHA) protein